MEAKPLNLNFQEPATCAISQWLPECGSLLGWGSQVGTRTELVPTSSSVWAHSRCSVNSATLQLGTPATAQSLGFPSRERGSSRHQVFGFVPCSLTLVLGFERDLELPPTHTCTHIHFLSALMAGADKESPSSLLTSNTSMSALLKSMLRILGRGTPEPRTAVKGVGGESGQVSSMWPRGGSLAKSNQHLQDHSCLFCLLEVPAQKKPRLALALLCKGGMT